MIALAILVVLLGLWCLISALANWDWIYALHEYAAIETIFGESAARWVCGVTGLIIIGLGASIGISVNG